MGPVLPRPVAVGRIQKPRSARRAVEGLVDLADKPPFTPSVYVAAQSPTYTSSEPDSPVLRKTVAGPHVSES